ncbi:MAG TPA: DUF4431 domain-containing protein [Longimicrobium sp.]
MSGQLVISPRFGPPNFGETPDEDEKLQIPFLILEHEAAMCRNPDTGSREDPPIHSDTVQLNLIRVGNSWFREDGKHVIARGSLYPGTSGYHFSKVLMMVDSISLSPTDSARLQTGSK